MFLLDDSTVVYSATDLAAAAACEYSLIRHLEAKLPWGAGAVETVEDAMLERTARLGDAHEERVLDEYRQRFGRWNRSAGTGVVEIERPPGRPDRAALEAKREETLDALRAGADVVFQAGFFDGRFSGWADFLVREPSGEYAVHDTKLARHAKVTALLQLAAYADQLLPEGVPTSGSVHLLLGDGTTTNHRLADLLPVYRARRARLQHIIDSHVTEEVPLTWGAPHLRACLRCEICAPELEARRDVLLVAGMRTTQRARLRAAGVETIDQLAAGEGPMEGIGRATVGALRAQASLQAAQHPPSPGDQHPPSSAGQHPLPQVEPEKVHFDLHDPEAVAALPVPDFGDIFFDFEGDPLWSEGATGGQWGLEYLFGLVEAPQSPGSEPRFRAFWAHDRGEERQALTDFLDYLAQRRAKYPGMHVYHYAAYEKSALLRLAGRHGVGEEIVDDLLRQGVFVDLYATVRASLRTGQDSYSIKKLEPLYLSESRRGEVTTAGDSVVEYALACAERDAGNEAEWQRRLAEIADYNRLDCVSTFELRDWLLAQAAAVGHAPAHVSAEVGDDDDAAEPIVDELAQSLLGFAGEGPDRDADRQALAMLAAALGYHAREDKPFWWGHFDRLASHPEEWTEKRSTLVVDEAEVVRPWGKVGRAQTLSRDLRITGRLEPGSELVTGARAWALYDPPLPDCASTSTTGLRGWTTNVTVLDVEARPDGTDVLVVGDRLPRGAEPHDCLPMALAPTAGPGTSTLRDAIRGLAEDVSTALPAIPDHPALDIVRRRPPRLLGGAGLPQPAGDDGYIDAMTDAALTLDGSYLAVQGPPGTGKTYVGARVITRLVEQGWRVGVVAQSHAVVENMLDGIGKAGLPAGKIGKKPPDGGRASPLWTALTDSTYARFYDQPGGFVVGGTSWTFTNAKRLPAEPLDLLVVDEAGQFSLANTVAVSTAARSLLLLGDPQQLPQVSQGRHPEPVDRSALGWLTDGHDTLPPELGYFLARTWRMHPALTKAVSRLSYEDRLTSMPCTAERSLAEVAPGVRGVPVEHAGNAVSSTQEAEAVVEQARAVVGRRWHDPADGTDRLLEPSDVLVVAAYNAQVWTVRRALANAGLDDVRVGTVDKFQGQQAPVVIVTLAASSADDVPRGTEFLLNRNRLNVAVSRGQWCAVVVHSPALADHLPTRPERLEELGAFLGLVRSPEVTGRHTVRG